MAKTTIPGKSLAKQLAELKSLSKNFDVAKAKVIRQQSELFIRTYRYCTGLIQQEKVDSRAQSIDMLAGALKRKPHGVEYWYYCGKFMNDHRLTVSADARAVRTVMQNQKTITRADLLKCLSWIKSGKPYSTIAKTVRLSILKAGITADRKAKRIKRRGELNATRVKLEGKIVAWLAQDLWGEDCVIEIRQNGKVRARIQ